MSPSDNDDHILHAFQQLQLSQRRELATLLHRQRAERSSFQTSVAAAPQVRSSSSSASAPPSQPLDYNKRPLSIGQIVKLRTTAKSGRIDDTAKVTGIGRDNKTILIRLHLTGTSTSRACHNLIIIPKCQRQRRSPKPSKSA